MSWCPRCAAEVPVRIELGGSSKQEATALKPVKVCVTCGTETMDELPAPQAAPVAQVVELPKRAGRPVAPQRPAPAARTADEIVAQARAQLAELEVDIPRLEADLAHARAHRKGLARMIAAYERGSKE